MKQVKLPSGEQVSALGQGTWRMGDKAALRAEEIATLRLGLDLGLTLIDTAEMYGGGRSEALIGEAIAGRRQEAFIVSKVMPNNASRRGTVAACEQSLRHLKTDHIDLYLLHWRGSIPLGETLDGFDALLSAGKIRYWGVSNFDPADMEELISLASGSSVTTNQVLYNLSRRGVEWDLLPWLRSRSLPMMAYSPVEQARLLDDAKLKDFAERHGMTPAQVALAWLLAADDVIVIPKTSHRQRLQENVGALEHPLTEEQLVELDRLFPAPTGPQALEML
jgi:aldehyde reductase